MVMVSFCWEMNFLPSRIKNKSVFIDDVLEINDQSHCILSGPPCIVLKCDIEYCRQIYIVSRSGIICLNLGKARKHCQSLWQNTYRQWCQRRCFTTGCNLEKVTERGGG